MRRLLKFRLKTVFLFITIIWLVAVFGPPMTPRIWQWFLEKTCPQVAFRGNDAIGDSELRSSIGLLPFQEVTPKWRHGATKAITDLYRSRGYYLVRVGVEQTKTDNGWDTAFIIDEGIQYIPGTLLPYAVANKSAQ